MRTGIEQVVPCRVLQMRGCEQIKVLESRECRSNYDVIGQPGNMIKPSLTVRLGKKPKKLDI